MEKNVTDMLEALKAEVDALRRRVEALENPTPAASGEEVIELEPISDEEFAQLMAVPAGEASAAVAPAAPEPVEEPASEPIVEAVASAPEPVEEPAPEPVVEPLPAPVEEPAAEPVVEAAEPAATPEPVAEPASEPVEEPGPIEDIPADLFGDFASEPAPRPSVNDAGRSTRRKAIIDAMEDNLAWKKDIPGTPVLDVRSAISLNDRILFITKLFHEDPMRFREALEQLNGMKSLDEAIVYLQSLNLGWDFSSELVYRFMMAVRRKLQ